MVVVGVVCELVEVLEGGSVALGVDMAVRGWMMDTIYFYFSHVSIHAVTYSIDHYYKNIQKGNLSKLLQTHRVVVL